MHDEFFSFVEYMPYSVFTIEELLEKYQQEKERVLAMLIRHPELTSESIKKLSESLRLIDAELKKRGEKGYE